MTKVNPPSFLFFFHFLLFGYLFIFFNLPLLTLHPVYLSLPKRFPSLCLDGNVGCMIGKMYLCLQKFSSCTRCLGRESAWRWKRSGTFEENLSWLFFFPLSHLLPPHSLLQTASNLLPKPGPPGNQHPQDSGTAVGKMSLHMVLDRGRKYLGRTLINFRFLTNFPWRLLLKKFTVLVQPQHSLKRALKVGQLSKGKKVIWRFSYWWKNFKLLFHKKILCIYVCKVFADSIDGKKYILKILFCSALHKFKQLTEFI